MNSFFKQAKASFALVFSSKLHFRSRQAGGVVRSSKVPAKAGFASSTKTSSLYMSG